MQNNQLSEKIDITDKKAEYDENVKWLLSEKIILAHILVHSVKEFRGMDPQDVVGLIGGTEEVLSRIQYYYERYFLLCENDFSPDGN